MAKYKCANVAGKNKCSKEAEGYVTLSGTKYLFCKSHAVSGGYSFREFNDVELEAMGKKPKSAKGGKPSNIFGSDPKKRKK